MSDESPLQTRLTTDVPLASDVQENYILLLVLLCAFAGGTLMLLFILLIFCHRCCGRQRRHSRASEDQEKTNTTYVEESQPAQDVSFKPDSGDSVSGCRGDTDGDHFLSAACTTRRVSFNETAIYDRSAKDKERGRRYTLTEGDFHHLKKSRLTHAPPPPAALKIVTIPECDTSEHNIIDISDESSHTHSLAIFQPADGPSPDSSVMWTNQNSSCVLPGDSLNTNVPTNPSQTLEMMNRNTLTDGDSVSGSVAAGPALTQGSMFHFLSKLRRHASLEGAGPFYSVKKWSFDTVQRAASLDTRGSSRRRAFQRQRAASETLDTEEEHLQAGVCDFLLRNPPVRSRTEPPRRLSAGSLESFCRLHVSTRPSSHENGQTSAEDFRLEGHRESFEQPSLYRDIWSLRASLEQYASSDLSSNDADSVCSAGASRAPVASYQSQDIDDEMDGDGELPYDGAVREAGPRRNGRDSVDSDRGADGESSNRKLLQMDSGYASIEAPCKPLEEFRLFGSVSASERRRFFTSAGRKGTVCESFESRLFKEELEVEEEVEEVEEVEEEEEEEVVEVEEVEVVEVEEVELEEEEVLETESPRGTTDASKPRATFRRRDYSIDEKTEALFNEFLRHDPQLDPQPSLRHRHRSRVHLRKQWQRSKQYSDPGAARYSPSLERQRCYPLRRGDSANYPLDTRYHSTLPRIASAADEEEQTGPQLEGRPASGPDVEENSNNSSNNTSRRGPPSHAQDDTHERSEVGSSWSRSDLMDTRHVLTDSSPSDKLLSDLEPDRLYSSLRTCREKQERFVSVTSPDLDEE